MRRVVAILILFSWVFQTFAPGILYSMAREQMRKEHMKMAKRMSRGGRVFVFHNEKEIQWEKPGQEFEFEGMLYDVMFAYDSSSCKVIRAIEDRKENSLVDKYSKTRRDKEHRKSLLKKLGEVKGLTPVDSEWNCHLVIKDHCWNPSAFQINRGHLNKPERPPTLRLI